jgi:hypothetical protein
MTEMRRRNCSDHGFFAASLGMTMELCCSNRISELFFSARARMIVWILALPITLDARQDAIRQHLRKMQSPETDMAPASTKRLMCDARSHSTLTSLG